MKYRAVEAESQSSLKNILIHPLLYKSKVNKSTKSLSMGSLVDCLLLTPKDFDKTYLINKMEDPPEAVKKIYDLVYKSWKAIEFIDVDVEIINICKQLNYRQTQGDVVKLKYITKYDYYLKFLKKAENKIIVSSKDYERACELTGILNKDTVINNEVFNLSKDEENIFQKEIYWVYDGVPLKSLLDLITVNHKKKTIQPWDLKTTGFAVDKFENSLYKFRYDFQASFYTEALMNEYPDYKILPFRFIVVSTVMNDRPRIFECSERVLSVGKIGDDKLKGWLEALETLKFHAKTNIWNDTKRNIEGGDIIKLI
jgi:hypothetical protein